MRESDILRAIKNTLGQRRDMRIWRANAGGAYDRHGRYVQFGEPGQADLSGILMGGRRLEIEVKTPQGNQSEEQRFFGETILRFGGLYVVARSVEETVAAVEAAIQRQS